MQAVNIQGLRQAILEKEFQIYALSEYGNLLFAYSPKLPVLSEQCLRILPISIQYTNIKKYCFQRLNLGDLTGSIVHNKQVVWGFFTKSSEASSHAHYSLFFLSLFLKFLNSKPNTLQGILNTEKDKTDRQGYEFGLKDLTVESLNTYNDCFQGYKEFVETEISEHLQKFEKELAGFNGFVMTVHGELIHGELGSLDKFRDILVNRAKKMRDSYRCDFSNMKVELSLVTKKIVLLAGFCPALNGLIVGITSEIDNDSESFYKFVHNISIYWDSDHGPLAQKPESLYKKLENTSEALQSLLQLLVSRSVKGPKFCTRVSPGQSRIHLSQELNLEHFPITETSFNISTIQHVENFEGELIRDPISNISIIEQNLAEEEIEDYFGITQERVTPALVNLDEIVEEVQDRRSKTPSQMDGSANQTPGLMRSTKNGRWYRKSTEQIKLKPKVPKLGALPPIKSEKRFREIKRSNSSKDLRDMQLFEFEDMKKLGLKDIGECMEKYAIKNHRPPRDDWIDFNKI